MQREYLSRERVNARRREGKLEECFAYLHD